MSMLYKMRSDAQRAADAAALAGAAAYQKQKPYDAVDSARLWALDYVRANSIGNDPIDVSDTTVVTEGTRTYVDFPQGQVQVIPDSEKVRVILHRQAVNTWFARILGKPTVDISAKAAAIAAQAGQVKCIKPFAFPDMWHDADNDPNANRLEDVGPGQGKGGEAWEWNAGAGDTYRRWNDAGSSATQWTGLGSGWRNNYTYADDKASRRYWDDYGRPTVLKKANPQQTMAPGNFMPWVMPGSDPGAADYKENIYGCNPNGINLNQEYTTDPAADTSSYDNKPGNMIGPTKQGMDSLIKQDPKACWAEFPDVNHSGYTSGAVKQLDASGKCTVDYPDWENSPRVILIPLMDPSIPDNGKHKVKFNNIALLFVEEQKGRHDPVVGRFLYFAKGTKAGTVNTCTLCKTLRLVE